MADEHQWESLPVRTDEESEALSSEEQLIEWERCATSFMYWSQQYARITNPGKGRVPFILYEYQKRVLRDFEEHRYNILRKFRQGGLTTLATMWCLWRCLFKVDQRIMVLSKSDREARNAGKLVGNALKWLPAWMRPQLDKDNEHEKIFADTNGSLLFYTPEGARSQALTYLIVDEAAFIKKMDEHWKAMYPTVSTGGGVIVISTVNGLGNWYEEMYHGAQEGRNPFHVIDLDYWEHPDYKDEEWARRTRAALGERAWMQEILGSFLGSGDTYINGKIIAELELATRKTKPVWKKLGQYENDDASEDNDAFTNPNYQRGALWIWKDKEVDHQYLMAADVAEGVGGDNSAFHIFDMNTNEQVAEFYSNVISSHEFAQVIHNVGQHYNTAQVIVDNLGVGAAVVEKLEHWLHYENLYYEQTGANNVRGGFRSTQNSRPMLLDALQTALNDKMITINSSRFVRELKTFIFNKQTKRAQAQKNKHDDLTMSMAMLLKVREGLHRNIPVGAQTKADTELYSKTLLKQIKAEINGCKLEDLLDDDILEDIVPGIQMRGEKEMMMRIMYGLPPKSPIMEHFGTKW